MQGPAQRRAPDDLRSRDASLAIFDEFKSLHVRNNASIASVHTEFRGLVDSVKLLC